MHRKKMKEKYYLKPHFGSSGFPFMKSMALWAVVSLFSRVFKSSFENRITEQTDLKYSTQVSDGKGSLLIYTIGPQGDHKIKLV